MFALNSTILMLDPCRAYFRNLNEIKQKYFNHFCKRIYFDLFFHVLLDYQPEFITSLIDIPESCDDLYLKVNYKLTIKQEDFKLIKEIKQGDISGVKYLTEHFMHSNTKRKVYSEDDIYLLGRTTLHINNETNKSNVLNYCSEIKKLEDYLATKIIISIIKELNEDNNVDTIEFHEKYVNKFISRYFFNVFNYSCSFTCKLIIKIE